MQGITLGGNNGLASSLGFLCVDLTAVKSANGKPGDEAKYGPTRKEVLIVCSKNLLIESITAITDTVHLLHKLDPRVAISTPVTILTSLLRYI